MKKNEEALPSRKIICNARTERSPKRAAFSEPYAVPITQPTVSTHKHNNIHYIFDDFSLQLLN